MVRLFEGVNILTIGAVEGVTIIISSGTGYVWDLVSVLVKRN